MSRADDAAFEDLVRPLADRLFRTALLLCGTRHQAEDLVQTTLAKFYVSRKWRKIDFPNAYLRRMLVNEWNSIRRRRSFTERVTDELPERLSEHAIDDDAAAHLDLLRALGQLSRVDRTVVVLRYWDDLSVTDTAALTGLSPGAVRNRSGRALLALRGLLSTTADVAPTRTTTTAPDPSPVHRKERR